MFNPIIVLYTYFPQKLALRVLILLILAAAFSALFDLLWRKGKLGRNKARLYMVLFLYLLGLFFVIVLGRRTLGSDAATRLAASSRISVRFVRI